MKKKVNNEYVGNGHYSPELYTEWFFTKNIYFQNCRKGVYPKSMLLSAV